MAEHDELTACQTHLLWHYLHHPEEYTADFLRCLAAELHLSPAIFNLMTPLINRILHKWEHAAVETTEYKVHSDGTRLLRTIFTITQYPSYRILAFMEKVLRALGAGRSIKTPSTKEFGWLLIGGILTDYARRAGVKPSTTQQLLEFRLRNSDHYTLTSWYPDYVEIANLKTAEAERLYLEESEIAKIIDYAVHYQTKIRCKRTRCLSPDCSEWENFYRAIQKYESMKE